MLLAISSISTFPFASILRDLVKTISRKSLFNLFLVLTILLLIASCSQRNESEKDIDILVLLDQSSSMAGTIWDDATSALESFADSSFTRNIFVSLQYFPVAPPGVVPTDCVDDISCGVYGPCIPLTGGSKCSGSFAPNSSCDPADYIAPEIVMGDINDNRQLIINSLAAKTPEGESTTTQPALDGAISYLTSRAGADAKHTTVVILITDGDPTGCMYNTNTGAASIAAAAFNGPYSIKTFVMLLGSEVVNGNQIAVSGGTQSAYTVDTGLDIHQQVIDSLNSMLTEIYLY